MYNELGAATVKDLAFATCTMLDELSLLQLKPISIYVLLLANMEALARGFYERQVLRLKGDSATHFHTFLYSARV